MQVNGVNLMHVPAKDVNAYGRALLDLLFTKHEQKALVIFESKTTSKQPLDPAQVEKIFGENSQSLYVSLIIYYVCYFSKDRQTKQKKIYCTLKTRLATVYNC